MAELKKLLKERGLSTTGNKSNLLERLSNAGDSKQIFVVVTGVRDYLVQIN